MSAGSTDPVPIVTPEDLTAAAVMTPVSRTCSPFSTVTEAVMIFKEQDSDVVPVVDAGKPLGVVIDRDVALAVADSADVASRPVSEIMITNFPTVAVDDHVDKVLQTMSASESRLALVLDAEGLLAGLIFWADLSARLPGDAIPTPGTDDDVPAEVKP